MVTAHTIKEGRPLLHHLLTVHRDCETYIHLGLGIKEYSKLGLCRDYIPLFPTKPQEV